MLPRRTESGAGPLGEAPADWPEAIVVHQTKNLFSILLT
jgi:hypothetical protein